MKKVFTSTSIRKKVLISVLTVCLLGNSVQFPGTAMQAYAEETEETISDIDVITSDMASDLSEDTIMDDTAVLESETVSDNNTVSEGETVSDNNTVSEGETVSDNNTVSEGETVSDNNTVSEGETVSDNNTVSEGETVSDNDTVSENNTVSDNNTVSENDMSGEEQAFEATVLEEILHIGQISDSESLPNPGDAECSYDEAILLENGNSLRLFADFGALAVWDTDKEAEWKYTAINRREGNSEVDITQSTYMGTLSWSILRGDKDAKQGSTNLTAEEDDWTEFQEVTSSAYFTVVEDEDNNSPFYKTLTISATETTIDDGYSYYIRATYQYDKEGVEYTAITTVPVVIPVVEDSNEETVQDFIEDMPIDAESTEEVLDDEYIEKASDAEENNDHPTDADGNILPISDEVWVAGFERESESLVYTGKKVTQNLRVYHEGKLLKVGTDYSLTYKNNVNAAEYDSLKAPSVKITMKGQYNGSRTFYYSIAPRNIDENHTAGYEQILTYSRTMKAPVPNVYYNGKKLVNNKDFTCNYSTLPEKYTQGDSYEEGKVYEYTVYGIGNYTGSFTMRLSVVSSAKLDFGKATVKVDKTQYVYSGSALTKENIQVVSVKLGGQTLDTSLYDYEVMADNAGTGYVTVYPTEAGKQKGYRSCKEVKIKVVGDRKIKDAYVDGNWKTKLLFSQVKLMELGGIYQESENILFYGEEAEKEVLTEGVDYKVQYKNNKKAGTATVVFTGIGRYQGSLSMKYTIIPDTALTIDWQDTDAEGMPTAVYAKGGAMPQFDLVSSDGTVLQYKTDYTTQLKSNQKVGIMTCKITGKGNYKGYISDVVNVKVLPKDINLGTIETKDKAYSTRANAWKTTITIKDVNGKKLVAGTDYKRELIYDYEGMEEGKIPQSGTVISVTAEGINNYEGSQISGTYHIYAKPISKLTIAIDPQVYTGKQITLAEKDIHVYANAKDKKAGIEIEEKCYEIVGYKNNIKVGTAQVTLRGVGEYGATKTVSFKIIKKEYLTTSVTDIVLSETELKLGRGKSAQLEATILPANADNQIITWTSSNTKVATVERGGFVKGLQAGTATISAISKDTGVKATCTVEVIVIPVTSFTIDETIITLDQGTTYQIEIQNVKPEDATYDTVQWESSNPMAVSVDSNGLVTLNSGGRETITASTMDGKCVCKCMVISNSTIEESYPQGEYLLLQDYMKEEDENDTIAFNRAIDALSEECNTLYVPAGVYMINPRLDDLWRKHGIALRDNMNLIMSPNAVLKVIGVSGGRYAVILADGIDNVTISGGTIMGERYEHSGTDGEDGMGIRIEDSTNVTVTDVDISDCWGDGIYIGRSSMGDGCYDITVTNCNLTNNRRNNLSITCGSDIIIDNCSFTKANGTAPEAGICIEANSPLYRKNERIQVRNSTISGNKAWSVAISYPHNVAYEVAADDIEFYKCTLKGTFYNYCGTNVRLVDCNMSGEIKGAKPVKVINN